MSITPYTSCIDDFLKEDDVVDFSNKIIIRLSDKLYQNADSKIDYIKTAFEYVRDCIHHSADADEDEITCSASEVLYKGHGICFAKSHLLAALFRCKGIPAGFCYQKLILDDETAPVLILHGLNAVYISEIGKWIRLDARGNKAGVDSQFSLEDEKLAFPVRPDRGEEDGFTVFPSPDELVLQKMKEHKTRTELFHDLPKELKSVL